MPPNWPNFWERGHDGRGVRVYPYSRVYPTRPVPAGTGRVDFSRVGSRTGTTSTGTDIPGFTRKEHDFGASVIFVNENENENYQKRKNNDFVNEN